MRRCLAVALLVAAPRLAAQTPETIDVYYVSAGAQMTDLLRRVSRPISSGIGDAEIARIVASQDHWGYTSPGIWRHVIRFRGRPSMLTISIGGVAIGGGVVRFVASDPAVAASIRSVLRTEMLTDAVPIERAHITLSEPLSAEGQPPAIRIMIRSAETYPTTGYHIVSAFARRGDTLQFTLLGVTEATGPFHQTASPAMTIRSISLPRGRYTIEVVHRTKLDRVTLEVTDVSMGLQAVQPTFVVADPRAFFRRADNSFALLCGGATAVVAPCNDFAEWIAKLPGVFHARSPTSGADPSFPYATEAFPPHLFRFQNASVLAAVRSCMTEIGVFIRDAAGLAFVVRTWAGEELSAASRRTINESPIASPARLTTGPVCSHAERTPTATVAVRPSGEVAEPKQTMIQFATDDIVRAVAGRTLIAARLELTHAGDPASQSYGKGWITVHRMLADWKASGATWAPDSTARMFVDNLQTGGVTLDVTRDVLGFVNGDTPNYGWTLRLTGVDGVGRIAFASSEAAQGAPRLVLTVAPAAR